MAKFKNTEFAKDINLSFADFKKVFAKTFTDDEMEQAYKIATDGNISTTTKKSKKTKRKSTPKE